MLPDCRISNKTIELIKKPHFLVDKTFHDLEFDHLFGQKIDKREKNEWKKISG